MAGFSEYLRKNTESLYRLNAGAFDLDENVRDGSCLGTAVISAPIAIQLVLVGMQAESIEYFENIKLHAVKAYAMNESYAYADYDGQNLFARFMANRLAGLSAWALGHADWQTYYSLASAYLARAIQFDVDRVGKSEAMSDFVAPCNLFLTLGILESWDEVLREAAEYDSSSRNKCVELAGMIVQIAKTALRVVDISEERSVRDFDEWFVNRMSQREASQKVLDSIFSNIELVDMARLRAQTRSLPSDPLAIIRTIASPHLQA